MGYICTWLSSSENREEGRGRSRGHAPTAFGHIFCKSGICRMPLLIVGDAHEKGFTTRDENAFSGESMRCIVPLLAWKWSYSGKGV